MSILIEGKYRVITRIGEGSFGDIFAGYNINTNEKVAIKISKIDSNILLKNSWLDLLSVQLSLNM